MGFRQDAYAKIWKVYDLTNGATIQFANGESKTYPPGNYSIAQISIGKLNKSSGEFENEFSSNFVRLVGNAHSNVGEIQKRLDQEETNGKQHPYVSIKISSCDVTNRYYEPTKTTYTNFVIFGFEFPDDNRSNSGEKANSTTSKKLSQKTTNEGFMNIPDGIDAEELPFN